jgi:hypothetical protein
MPNAREEDDLSRNPPQTGEDTRGLDDEAFEEDEGDEEDLEVEDDDESTA